MLVWLLTVNQVFTDYDRRFLEKQIEKGQLHNLLIVVSQIDSIPSRNINEVVEYARKQLKDVLEDCESPHLLDTLQIFPVSALQSLLNRDQTAESEWIEIQKEERKSTEKWTDEQSRMPAFEARLRQFLFGGERAKSESEILLRRLKNIVQPQFKQIEIFLSSLDMPLKELEENLTYQGGS
jgi:hypothetical protein